MNLGGLFAGLLLCTVPASAATLRDAIRADDTAQVKALLDAGARVNQTDDLGATPLHDAVWLGNETIVRLLLDHGAKVDARHTEGGSTPLLFAVLRGQSTIAQLLVTRGADVNVANAAGATGLHFAARRGDVAMVRIFLDHGTDPARRDHTGMSPLDEAAGQGSVEAATALLEHVSDDGSALQKADSPAMLALLLGRGKYPPEKLSDRLLQAVLKSDEKAAKLLLSHNASLSTPGVLHAAVGRGLTAVAAALLDAGADPNLPDADGIPPLHEAALQGHEQVIRLLVKHGARLDSAEPAAGSTPIYAAASMGRLAAVRALLELGANPELRAKSGRTPREAAASSGFTEIANLLR